MSINFFVQHLTRVWLLLGYSTVYRLFSFLRLDCRIPRNSFASNWIRIVPIVLRLVQQRVPTHWNEVVWGCGVFCNRSLFAIARQRLRLPGRWSIRCNHMKNWSAMRTCVRALLWHATVIRVCTSLVNASFDQQCIFIWMKSYILFCFISLQLPSKQFCKLGRYHCSGLSRRQEAKRPISWDVN